MSYWKPSFLFASVVALLCGLVLMGRSLLQPGVEELCCRYMESELYRRAQVIDRKGNGGDECAVFLKMKREDSERLCAASREFSEWHPLHAERTFSVNHTEITGLRGEYAVSDPAAEA